MQCHKRSRCQQREAGLSTSQPIVAPTTLEPPKGTPLAPLPAANPLKPGEFSYEWYHSVAMSGAPGCAGYVSHCDATPGPIIDKRLRLLLTLIK